MISIKRIDTGHDLDTPPSTELRATKTLDLAPELGRITQDAALSVSLAPTPNNAAALRDMEPDNLDDAPEEVPVEVLQDGNRLPLSAMSVLRSSAAQGYEVELFAAEWYDALKRVVLNELDLGNYPWTVDRILQSWTNILERSTEIALPPLVNYGGWNSPGQVTRRDLRFWFNVGKLLKAVFSSIGWCLKCPHLEDGNGRYWYAYLSGLRWHRYSTKMAEQFVTVTTEAQDLSGAAEDRPAWSVVADQQSRWQTFGRQNFPTYNYLHEAGQQTTILLTVEFTANVVLPPAQGSEIPILYVSVNQYNHRSVTPIEIYRQAWPGGTGSDLERTISFIQYFEIELPPYTDRATGEQPETYAPRFEVVLRYETGAGPVPFTVNSATAIYRPDPRYYIEGENIPLGELLDPELTGRDLFDAVAHLINGKVVTDEARREVTLFAPFDYERFGDGRRVPGFYDRSVGGLDLTDLTAPGSMQSQPVPNDQPRYRVYDFADGDDAYIEQIGRERFRRRVDLGRGAEDEREIPNPLFGPTANIYTDQESVGGFGVYIPALWDNADGEISHEPGPRIAVWYGNVIQAEGDNSFNFEGQPRGTVPFMSMIPDSGIAVDQQPEPLTFAGYATDLWGLFHRREVMNEQRGPTVSFLLNGGDETYNAIDFRRPLLIRGPSANYLIQPIAVRDHAFGSSVPLLVEGKVLKC